jgi:hypothetical protein
MKFARRPTPDGVVPVVEADGRWYDLTPIAPDVDPTALAPGIRERMRSALGPVCCRPPAHRPATVRPYRASASRLHRPQLAPCRPGHVEQVRDTGDLEHILDLLQRVGVGGFDAQRQRLRCGVQGAPAWLTVMTPR